MRLWKKKSELDPSLVSRQAALSTELADYRLKRDIAIKEAQVADLREREAHQIGSPSVRSRIEARIEARREARRKSDEHHKQLVCSQILRGLDQSDGLALCSSAVAVERPGSSPATVRSRIGESITENLGFMPFSYDFLTSAFRSLYQVQGLIREMYPYKDITIRYLPTLDFARWACKVLHAECPTAQGLIRAKTAFVIRKGNKVSLVRKDKGNTISDSQKKGQWFIDRFLDENNFAEKERERYQRRCIQGEAFGWTADPQKGKETANGEGACEFCFVEPDYIRPSQKDGASQEDPHMLGMDQPDWSFGILTPKHKYHKPLAYQVVWNDNEEQKIDAKYMVHSAERPYSNMKRCHPPLLLSSDDLIRMTLLRSCLAESSRYRAAVAGVVEYEEASEEEIKTGDDIYGRSLDGACDNDDDWEMRSLKIEGGSYLLELPPGRKFSDGPLFPPGDSLALVYDWHIRAIAQQWGVPEWLVKGASAGSSFADSLTAESPSVVEFETEQSKECRYTKLSVTRELQYRMEVGHLPSDFLDEYAVVVRSDSVITRDSKAETETAVMQVEKQLNSLQGARADLGLDPDIVDKQIAAEKTLGVGPVWSKTPQMEQDKELAMKSDPKTTGGERQKLQGE